MGEPSGDSVGDPRGDPSGDPVGEPKGDPSGDPVGEPSGDPVGDPRGDPSGDPSGDPVGEPKGDPSGDPAGEPKGDPSGDPVGDPAGEPKTAIRIVPPAPACAKASAAEILCEAFLFLPLQEANETKRSMNRKTLNAFFMSKIGGKGFFMGVLDQNYFGKLTY